jgi:hypothetical protein
MNATDINTSKLAEAIGYNEINAGDCIMIHKNSGDFSIVTEEKVSARNAQGWTECVSAATLDTLGLIGETSDDGEAEAVKLAEWMKAQA